MLNSNHPDDERLSALAWGDTDATADASLTGHVSTCDRCTDLVTELGALRVSLAELPDLEPSRPLRLLPGVADEPARLDRIGGWARRFFGPVLAAGAAIAMVGLVGTTAPSFSGQASFPGEDAGGDAGTAPTTMAAGEEPAAEADNGASVEDGSDRTVEGGTELFGASSEAAVPPAAGSTDKAPDTLSGDGEVSAFGEADESREALTQLPAERSPWPMVLFTGLAIMVAAAVLRWILVPRAG